MRITYLILLLLSGISNAGTIDPNNDDNKYIEYGKKYSSVVRLCGKYEDGSQYCASAVIIKPRWILTAAHVVKKSKRCLVRINDKQTIIDKIICHENFNEDNFGFCDIAIGHSSEPLEITEYPSLYTDSDEEGKLSTAAGLGLTGTFLTGCTISDQNKRAGLNIIDQIDRDLLVCSISENDPRSTGLEFLIASGDSGGGLFIDGRLAGINSCVMATDGKPNSSYGDESGHTRISKYVKWIEKVVNNE